MGAHKKQRIFSILAILTMAVILTCIFTACGDTGAQNATYKVTIHPNNGQADIVWDAKSDIPLITREGYHIVGYYLDGGLSISTSLESLKSTELTKNLDVYVKWEQDACQHKEVVDAAVAPTCTTTGLTEGKHCSVCRAILQVQTVVPALGHALVHHEAQDSTCTEVGWEEYDTCSRCDYTTYVEIKKKNHIESDWITDNAATCTVDGTKHIECTECHIVLQTGTIAATGHTESDWITDIEPTCTVAGTKHVECTECHTVLQTGTIDATGHNESDWITDKAATCTEDGTKHTECIKCHTVFQTGTISATGHSYSDWIIDVASTCEVAGSMHKECEHCGATENATIKALGHNLVHHDAKDATCTEIGWKAYDTCSRCNYSTYEEIAANGHTESDWITDSEATCTENGSKHTVCTVCNTIIHTVVLPATGHSYSDAWTHDETYHWHDATCGHDVMSDKAKHTYDEEWNCTVCGYHDDSLHGTEIYANTLTFDSENNVISGKVSNNTATFSFINEIVVAKGATYTVSTDINGSNVIRTKTVSLEIGDNTYYILVENGEDLALYTVTLRRRPIHTVAFDTKGGTEVQSQQVEEDDFATEPTTERLGYTFDKWDWNFDDAITDNTTVTASWNIVIYNIVYDFNIPNDSVSQDVDNSMNATTYTVEDEIVFAVPTRKGYTFAGWTVEKISKSTIDTVTTTANWTAINYDIVYDFGDATSVSKANNNEANPATYTIEDDVIFMVPTRVGYTFVSWDKNITKGMVDTQTITASWNIITYDIVYNLNVPAESVSQDVDNSMNVATYTVEDEIVFAAPIRKGYTFAGWTVEQISKGTIDTVTTTAKWTVINYDIVYDFGDATSASKANNNEANPATYTIEDEIVFKEPARNYYTFVEWNKTNISKGTTEQQTVVATWDAETHTITYVLNGWTNVSDNKASYTIEDQTFALFDGISGESLFCGWYLDEEYTNCIQSIDASTMKDYVVYAMPDCGATNGLVIQNGVVKSYSGASTDVVIPLYYKGKSVASVDQSAFRNCTKLTSVIIPNSVKNISSGAFKGCSSLESITIPFVGAKAGLTSSSTYQYPFGYIFGTSSYTGGVATEQYYYGSSTSSTTSATYYIPSSLKSVTVTGGNILHGAFYNFTGLTSVTIPDSVTSIGLNAFRGCTGLNSVTIGSGVTSIGIVAFYNCTGLTSVYYTGDVAGWCEISGLDNLMQYGSSSKTLYIGGNKLEGELIIPDSVTSIPSSAFRGCTGLNSVTIGSSVTSIGDSAFYGCTGLTTVNWNAIACTSAGSSNCPIFSGCINLTTVNIGENVTTIPSYAFRRCSGLTSVTIGSGVTSIGEEAFRNCAKLTSITIPDSVTSIAKYAFSDCTGLTSVFYAGTAEQWAAISIGSNNGYLTRATRIYNYDGVEKTYSFVTNCDESVDPVTAIYLSTLPTVTKEGHHFCGWYDNAEFAGNAIAAPYCSKDKTTLYAKWLTEEEWLASLDGTSFEMAFITESGKTYDVNITTGGQIVYFAFTPTASGSFTIQSTGSGDTYGTLYGASQSSLTTNDDDGDGNNFKITYTMTAGTTYYVAVKFYNSSTTGTFKVSFS